MLWPLSLSSLHVLPKMDSGWKGYGKYAYKVYCIYEVPATRKDHAQRLRSPKRFQSSNNARKLRTRTCKWSFDWPIAYQSHTLPRLLHIILASEQFVWVSRCFLSRLYAIYSTLCLSWARMCADDCYISSVRLSLCLYSHFAVTMAFCCNTTEFWAGTQ